MLRYCLRISLTSRFHELDGLQEPCIPVAITSALGEVVSGISLTAALLYRDADHADQFDFALVD